MPEYHDPYLNTAQRTLNDKQTKERKKKFSQKNTYRDQQSFLEQNIDLNNYLPKNLRNVIATALFIMLPYIIGVTFLFLIIAQANMDTYHKINANSFFLAWSIGYELIALTMLLIIIKSAISFHKIRKLKE